MGSSTGMLLSYEIIRLTSNSKDETVLIEEPFIIKLLDALDSNGRMYVQMSGLSL